MDETFPNNDPIELLEGLKDVQFKKTDFYISHVPITDTEELPCTYTLYKI